MRRHRRNKEISKSSNSPAEGCHFFKIILKANIRHRRLRIPQKFIRKLRDELSTIVVLKVPSGKVWSVGLRKSDGKVWFDKGWQEFVEYNSVLENYLLVFRYDGNSNFYVCIFDTTACEIEYPSDIMGYEENNPEDGCKIEEMEEQSCEEIFNVPPRSRKTTAASRKVLINEPEERQMTKRKCGCKIEEMEEQSCEEIFNVRPRPRKTTAASRKLLIDEPEDQQMTKSKGGCKIEEMEERSCEEIFNFPPRPKKTTASRKVVINEPEEQRMTKSRGRSDSSLKHEENKNIPVAQRYVHAKDSVPRKPILAQESVRPLEAAMAFKSTNPFCIVKMQPTYVSRTFLLHVPRSFAKTFATAGTLQGITLRVPDGRRWHVYCNSVLVGSGKKITAKITRGWKVFAQDNNLEEGDICIFELVRKSSIEVKVFIYRH